jgi:hypothetical protein
MTPGLSSAHLCGSNVDLLNLVNNTSKEAKDHPFRKFELLIVLLKLREMIQTPKLSRDNFCRLEGDGEHYSPRLTQGK